MFWLRYDNKIEECTGIYFFQYCVCYISANYFLFLCSMLLQICSLKITSEQPIFMNEFHGSTNQQIEGFSTDQSAINIYKSCFLNYKHAERVQVIVV